MRRQFMLFTLLSVIAAGVSAPSATAGPEAHDVTGRWVGWGFLQTDGRPATSDGLFIFDWGVPVQDGPRYSGLLSFADKSCVFTGTISESLHMSATGDCGPTTRLVFEGQATDTNEFGDIIPCVFEGRLTLSGMGGSQSGDLVMLHVEGGPTELAAGHWEGTATEQGSERTETLTAEFRSGTRGDAGVGEITLGDVSFDLFYDFSPIPGDGSPSGFSLVGGRDDGLVVMTGQFRPATDDSSATIEGMLTFVGSGGTGEPAQGKPRVQQMLHFLLAQPSS